MDFSKITNLFKKTVVNQAINLDDGVSVFKENYQKRGTMSLYGLSLYTNKAIDKRAETVAQIEFVCKDSKGEVVQKAETQKLLNLLSKPNKIFSGYEFFRLWQIYKDVLGQAYILIESKKEGVYTSKSVSGLHLLDPRKMKFEFNPITGEYTQFIYQSGNSRIVYSPEQIIRDFRPDPNNMLQAQSLLSAGIKNISTGIQLEDYQSTVLENGGRIEGIIKVKAPLNKNQVQEMKDSYVQQFGEAKRSGRPLFLGSDADYIRLSLSPEELAYIQSKNLNLNDICLMTSVPKVLLANVDDIKYSNSEESRAVFLRDTIAPLMKSLCTKLDWAIAPADITLDFIDPTPENREEKRKDLETANNIYAMTINEKRQALNLDPVADGDDILIPFNLTTLGAEAPAEEKKTYDDTEVKKKTDHPLRDYNTRRAYHKAYIKRADKNERLLLTALRRYLKEQAKRVIEAMNKKGMNEFFNKDLEVAIGYKTFLPILQEILTDGGQSSYDKFKLDTNIRVWLDEKVGIFARQINDTTFKELQRQFEESLANAENRDELVNRIESTYQDISKARAKMIARTEVQGAMQKGTFEGYKQSGVGIKIWVAVLDSKTRDAHANLDGVEVPLDQPFNVNGEAMMFPGDPRGGAENVINCRCSI